MYQRFLIWVFIWLVSAIVGYGSRRYLEYRCGTKWTVGLRREVVLFSILLGPINWFVFFGVFLMRSGELLRAYVVRPVDRWFSDYRPTKW